MDKSRKVTGNRLMIFGGLIIIFAIVLAIIVTVFDEPEEEEPIVYFTEITRDDLKSGNVSGFRLIDIRNTIQYNESHIGGALSIPYGCESCFIKKAKELLNVSDVLVLYGEKSESASKILHNLGFEKLFILVDFHGWLPNF